MLLTAQLDKNVLNELFYMIRNDVEFLKHHENIPPNRVRVSIPRYLLGLIVDYNHSRSLFEHDYLNPNKNIFGCQIIEGYNNQICVFDIDAAIDDKFLQPIEVKITTNKWIQINRL